ncbi:hypothetical protein CY34DRAFT_134073 [Suillus luteus UH-Slu-Lm8-n1]|uniref:Uncharacterized protein n=1 Tax=Suillus luteus UH-Slu-Lm8-n1 TaxID=930992 RepID=A0A0C9ZY31_9AGAM|nr:hypothetical protein CY34DRAFT_134073 [Suillus luteus UH-Slu-Lm8-n1]
MLASRSFPPITPAHLFSQNSSKSTVSKNMTRPSPHSDISGLMSSINYSLQAQSTISSIRLAIIIFVTITQRAILGPSMRALSISLQNLCYRKTNTQQIPISYVRHELFSILHNLQRLRSFYSVFVPTSRRHAMGSIKDDKVHCLPTPQP